MQGTAWRQAKVQLVLQSSEVKVWAIADQERLRQVLVSLLHWAVHHAMPGNGLVVGVERQPRVVIIQIQGSGISPPGSESPYFGGLSFSRSEVLVRAMGGALTQTHTPANETSFTITLRCVDL